MNNVEFKLNLDPIFKFGTDLHGLNLTGFFQYQTEVTLWKKHSQMRFHSVPFRVPLAFLWHSDF